MEICHNRFLPEPRLEAAVSRASRVRSGWPRERDLHSRQIIAERNRVVALPPKQSPDSLRKSLAGPPLGRGRLDSRPASGSNVVNRAARRVETMMKGLVPAAALAGLGALGLGVPSAAAQDKTVTLKIAHWLPPAHALHAAFDAWGKSVQEDSGGTIKYQLFPAQQ